ncbi:MAG: AAA family ATPase, partial [Proteobacteria bacterium]|nr:AAA family ATPase [Pseudomonadota bacterium]
MMQGRVLVSRYPDNRFFNGSIAPSLAILRQSLLSLTLGRSLTGSARHFTEGTATMDLPVGYDDFREVIENKLDFVDKSLFIKEVIEDKSTKAAVITRPRRFGKTFNLSLLHHFLANEIDGKPTQGLFDHLKITQWKDLCGEHQGKYPVIFITFKGVKDHRYEATYNNLCKLMSRVYLRHQDVLSSPKLATHQKKVFESIV